MSSAQNLFDEMNTHLLEDGQPSEYFNGISELPLLTEHPFSMLDRLKQTKQSPQHHPEGNVWNHTMLVVDEAARVKEKSKNPRVFMWAALLHDIGKPEATRNRKGKITSYNHDKIGANLVQEFLVEYTDDSYFIEAVTALVRWHMQLLFVVNDLRFAEVEAMKRQADIDEIALLGWCDRLGRLGADRQREESNVRLFVQKCKAFKE